MFNVALLAEKISNIVKSKKIHFSLDFHFVIINIQLKHLSKKLFLVVNIFSFLPKYKQP